MASRREALRAVGTAAVVASAGCAAPPAASGGDDGTDSDRDAVDDETLVAVSDGDDEHVAITYDHVASADEVQPHRQGGYRLPITLTGEGVDSLTEALRSAGALDDPERAEIRFYVDGELARTFGLGPGLAAAIREGRFDGGFLLLVASRDEAERLREELDGS